MDYRRPESALVVVHTRDGFVLLLKRVPPFDFWQSVTGSMKWDEPSPIHAAVRELREETGIVAQDSDLRDWNRTFKFEILPKYRHRYRPQTIYNVEHMFSMMLDAACDVRLDEKEHADYCWKDMESAIESVWSWSNKRALQLISEETP